MSSLLGSSHARPAEAPAPPGSTVPGGLDSSREALDIEHSLAPHGRPSRWIGWRLRLLVLSALAGCLALFLIVRVLAALPAVDAAWRVGLGGRIELVSSAAAALRGRDGAVLTMVSGRDGHGIGADMLMLQRSARWLTDDEQRARHRALHEQLSGWLAQGALRLGFADGTEIELAAQPRGIGGLGAMFWLLAAFALSLYMVAMVVLLARPTTPNAVYALMALCQAGNIGVIAIESTFELGLPGALVRWGAPLRTTFDLVTAAAIVHAATVHPRRLAGATAIDASVWLLVAALIALAFAERLPAPWWWTQGLVALLALAAIALLAWSYHREPHPFAAVMRRFALVTVGGWIVLTLAVALSASRPIVHHHVTAIGPVIWVIFFAALLLVVPFLSRSQQVLREFSMLAAVSTVATSLDLLFVAVFSFGQFASLTLSLFIALGAYVGLRQWIVNQMLGSGMQTAERMFEQLYRIAREVEVHPEQLPSRLMRLLRELFEPLEVMPLERPIRTSRVIADGSTLVVPVPDLGVAMAAQAPRAIAVRFAQRGRRLFTREDARLTDRVVEQLTRAVAHDRAVEQGRSEERARLAQDLHDDIGARLLTLMYKAPSPEMEDYVRHTLQDLKTLTRGLAASSHPLSYAVAEWKADIAQRLAVVQCELHWAASFDRDMVLSVVQWSALTRVLRELVSNTIAHAQATRVDIGILLEHDRLDLTVADNGVGHHPQSWSHGLGLGGVRKRVKQLGGEVEWRENLERGITCHVRIRELT